MTLGSEHDCVVGTLQPLNDREDYLFCPACGRQWRRYRNAITAYPNVKITASCPWPWEWEVRVGRIPRGPMTRAQVAAALKRVSLDETHLVEMLDALDRAGLLAEGPWVVFTTTRDSFQSCYGPFASYEAATEWRRRNGYDAETAQAMVMRMPLPDAPTAAERTEEK